MAGRRLRPHCSQALTATERQCAAFDAACGSSRRTTLRWLKTGTMRATPSSVAFCTMKSMRSPRGMHCTSVTASGDSRSTARPSPTAAVTREPRTLATVAANSRPSPANSTRCIAAARAQHLGEVSGGGGRQLDHAAGAQCGLHVDAGQPHAVALSRSYARDCRICYRAGLVHEDAPLQVDLESGLMRGVRQIASPNCDSRPAGVEPELIVVHGISLPPGEFGGPWIDRLFTNALPPDVHPYFAEMAALRVSSHLCHRARRRCHAVRELRRARLARGTVQLRRPRGLQ